MPKKNILGQRFGTLVVIDEAPSNKAGDAMWKCRCDCGKELIVKGGSLRSGNTQSCGCQRIKNLIQANHTRAKDLTNKRFGILTAIESVDNKLYGRKDIVWKCLCDCGNYTYVTSGDLLSGNTKSCGCQRNNSFGEKKIKVLLQQYQIKYIYEYSVDTCKYSSGYLARFDFYLPDYNTMIEYDGIQHSQSGTGNYDNPIKFKTTIEHDQIKNNWCHNNHITLIRIPYTHYNDLCINDLLPETSNFIV